MRHALSRKSRALAPKLADLSYARLSEPQDGSAYTKLPVKRPRFVLRPRLPRPEMTSNRFQSVLLEDKNPIQHPGAFENHKAPAPRVKGGHRQMSHDERNFFSNPYLRMAASPLRMCALTDRLVPRDLMLRFRVQRIPVDPDMDASQIKRLKTDGSGHIVAVVPAEDARGRGIALGRSFYVLCNRSLFDAIPSKGLARGIHKRHEMHPNLANLVSARLRAKCLLELGNLAAKCASHAYQPAEHGSHVICRRLRWSEWDHIVENGTIRSPIGAHGVLHFREPRTRRRRESDPPPSPDTPPDVAHLITDPPRPALPHAFLGLVAPDTGAVPNYRLPLYDVLSYFPDEQDRTMLRASLGTLLKHERNQRWKGTKPSLRLPVSVAQGGKDGPSEAYVLMSNSDTLARADVVPTLTALWRLRMWFDFSGDVLKSSWDR